MNKKMEKVADFCLWLFACSLMILLAGGCLCVLWYIIKSAIK